MLQSFFFFLPLDTKYKFRQSLYKEKVLFTQLVVGRKASKSF